MHTLCVQHAVGFATFEVATCDVRVVVHGLVVVAAAVVSCGGDWAAAARRGCRLSEEGVSKRCGFGVENYSLKR